MAKRLFLIAILATTFACKSSGTNDGSSKMSEGTRVASAAAGRDAIESGLLALGIDGRLMRIDMNSNRTERIRIAATHLLDDLLLLETEGDEPKLYALDRKGLQPRWVSPLVEPTAFPVAENDDTVVLVSRHYVTALEKRTGRRAMQFVGGNLDGLRRPPLKLPFSPTGGAGVGNDTIYIPSLGAVGNNKNLESFSLIVGARGWGYRASGDLMTTPVVEGGRGDPKLYFVTKPGLVTCMNAANYAYAPRAPRWEEFLEAPVDFRLTVTQDRRDRAGSVFAVDREGVVYCLNRVTGERRWVHATGERPLSSCSVFGNICVVRMSDGMCGFDADNVVYELKVEGGPDAGTYWARSGGPAVTKGGVTFQVEGEVLRASVGEEDDMTVDGRSTKSAAVHSGSKVTSGGAVIRVRDRGSDPYWCQLDYAAVLGRVGDDLIVRNDNTLVKLNAWTGAAQSQAVTLPGARLFPANTKDANLFVVGGDAVVYALFPR